MKHIVKYSMGICSAYIAVRLKEQCLDPICLFSDTMREDQDTYRFGYEVAERWALNLCEVSRGRDLWDIWRDEQFIPARQVSQCSRVMKIEPGQKFLAAWPAAEPARVAYGYDMDEQDRADNLSARWAFGDHLTPWFPLIEWGVSKEQCFGFFLEMGVDARRVYSHFQHANCKPCKNFGRLDWIALAYHYPADFAEALAFEAEAQQWERPAQWMQDGPLLRDLEIPTQTPSRKGRRKLAMAEPAFSFHNECGACAID